MKKRGEIKLSAAEMKDYERTLDTFRKACGYSISNNLLERRAMQAVLDRRRF